MVGNSYSQSNKTSFSLDQINGEVLVTVQIHSGNFCNGIQLLRSADSINFEVVGTIQGYCGNISETVTYNFTDSEPITNQKSYYQANLVGLESTEIKSILVLDFDGEPFKLTSNPVTQTSTLYFNNAPNKEVTLQLVSTEGKVAYTATGTDNYFDINATDYQNGLYIFSVIDSDNKVLANGKVLIRAQ